MSSEKFNIEDIKTEPKEKEQDREGGDGARGLPAAQ